MLSGALSLLEVVSEFVACHRSAGVFDNPELEESETTMARQTGTEYYWWLLSGAVDLLQSIAAISSTKQIT